jgi:thymidylate synthase
MIDSLGLSREFVRLDFLDRISPKPVNPGRAIEADEVGVLSKFLHDGLLDYTYSERLCNQYQFIIDLLIEHPNTRQAYMSVWDKAIDINRLEKMRVPCSLGYHFFIRDNKLVMIYSMRSLEVTKCLGNDIFTASLMLQYIANQVGVDYGYIQFHIGSMHIFG